MSFITDASTFTFSAITSIEGSIPTKEVYEKYFYNIKEKQDEILNYMQFNEMKEYKK